jgi:hypothetical protein
MSHKIIVAQEVVENTINNENISRRIRVLAREVRNDLGNKPIIISHSAGVKIDKSFRLYAESFPIGDADPKVSALEDHKMNMLIVGYIFAQPRVEY